MRSVRAVAIPVSTDAAGAGTATSPYPLSGLVVEVRMPNAGTAITNGGTTDLTFTRVADGGTILDIPNTDAPFQKFPARRLVTEAGGTTAYATGVGPVVQAGVPIDDYLRVVVGSGQLSASGTVFVYVAEGC